MAQAVAKPAADPASAQEAKGTLSDLWDKGKKHRAHRRDAELVDLVDEEMGEAPCDDHAAVLEADKKRKRGCYSDEQTVALAAHFAKTHYPDTDAKKALAERLGLDLDQVNKWFEKRRKKEREGAGEAGHRGRPSKAAAAAPQPPAGGLAADARKPASTAGAKLAAPATSGSMAAGAQLASTPRNPSAFEVAAGDAAVEPTPAADLRAPETLVKATAPEPASSSAAPSSGAAAAPTVDAAQPGADADGSHAAVRIISADERWMLSAELTSEANDLRERGLAAPLADLAAAAAVPAAFDDARLSALVAGQRLPLAELVAALLPAFSPDPFAGGALTADALRSRILDLATRKSHGPKRRCPASAAAAAVDALNDTAAEALWQWELRDTKSLPKEQRPAAVAIKRRAGRAAERLAAVATALRELEAHVEGRAGPKLLRALDALAKGKTFAQLEEEALTDAEAAGARSATAAQRAQHAAEKERQRQEREAERERRQAEAEREKLRKKTGFGDVGQLQKTASKFMGFFKPKPPAGTAAATGAAAGGSNPASTTENARAGSEGARGGAAGGGTTSKPARAAAERGYAELFIKPTPSGATPQPSLPPADESIDAAHAAGATAERAAAEWAGRVARARAAARGPEAAARRAALAMPPSWARRADAVAAAEARLREMREGGMDPGRVRAWRRKFLWFPGDRSTRPPFHGSWSAASAAVRGRRPLGRDASLDYEVMSDQEWEEEPEGSSLSGADSMSMDGGGGGGGHGTESEDSFVVEDGYLSDHEGVPLDDDDADAADGPADMAAGHGGAAEDGGAGGARRTERGRAAQALHAHLERAHQRGRPLIVTRFADRSAGGEAAAAAAAFVPGDPSLLEALAMEALLRGVYVEAPGNAALEEEAGGGGGGGGGGQALAAASREAAAAAAAPAAAAAARLGAGVHGGGDGTAAVRAGGGALGRPKLDRPDDLLPALAAFIQANSWLRKARIVEGFVEAHPGRCIPKFWVNEKVSELAERHGGGQWVLKAGRPPATAAAAAAAAHEVVAARADGAAGHRGALGQLLKRSTEGPGAPPAAAAAPSAVFPAEAATGGVGGFGVPDTAVAGAPPPLQVPASVCGPSDPYWSSLVQHIEGVAVPAQHGPSWVEAFRPSALRQHVRHMPAFVMSALVSALACGTADDDSDVAPGAAQAARTRCLRHAVDALVELVGEGGDDDGGEAGTRSQRAWGRPRASTAVASVRELCQEPGLLKGLAGSAAAAELSPEASRDAVRALAALAAVPEGRAVLADAEPEARAALGVGLEAWSARSEMQPEVDLLRRALSRSS